MRIIGRIYKTQIKDRIIGIFAYNRIHYLHLQNSQLNQFKRYLFPGTYVDLDYDEEKTFIRKGISAYFVNYIYQIFRTDQYHKIPYYDSHEINSSLSEFLNNLGNIMFLDLEMTMPTYSHTGKMYTTEIIQVGYVLVNGQGEEICRYSQYIKPKIHLGLSKRTLDFLNITAKDFYDSAIDYETFYEDFKLVIQEYRPTIVIFGKNDRITLNSSFQIHKVEPLNPFLRYVNLSKLIQSYYHLQNEPGLFKLYQFYYENQDIQIHDALNDSYVTMKVFKAFKNDVDLITDYRERIEKIF